MTSTAGKFLGNTVGEAAAFAAGVAISPVLHPIVQSLANEAWSVDPTKPLDAALIAEAVAHGHVSEADGTAEALLGGVSQKRFTALVTASRTGPGVQSAFELWRRGRITDGQFDGALTKAGIEPEWIALLHELKDVRLDPAVIALAIVRGIIADPGFLPVGPPSGEGNVRAFPTSPLDALQEAAASGWDRDRLFVQTAVSGRPMGPQEAAAATFRAILQRIDFDRAISEGDVRNEWADAIFETARQIPSATNYVEGRLRGWITDPEMNAGTAKHGMSEADTHLLFLTHGRPPSWHQVWIGLQRGGTYDGPLDAIEPAFLKALQESDLRPEWYNLIWHSRYNYPSPFVLRALAQSGDIDAATTAEVLKFLGWEPTFISKVVSAWTTGGTSAGKALTKTELLSEYEGLFITETELRTALTALGYTGTALDLEVQLGNARRVKKYRDAVVTAIHDAYLVHDIDDATATSELADANVSGTAASDILHQWQVERRVTIRDLTPAQIAKAVKKGVLTRDVGIARLEDMGYTPDDAATLIAET